MNEFDIIGRYFAPLSLDGLINDAAVLDIPSGHQLVVSSDTLNAGTHFLKDANPADIAHKALRVNLSDLAAMGATPLAYQLNIAYPEKPAKAWLQAFTGALAEDQQKFGIVCSGGDTTRIQGALSISITVMGTVEAGQALIRTGAQPGDVIVLTGPIGDAWIGLKMLQEVIQVPDDDQAYFIDRYHRPAPVFIKNTKHIQAAIDISDGFLADLMHICEGSGVTAHVDARCIPFSDQALRLLDGGTVTLENLLTGGDDYQLILAVPEDKAAQYGTIVGRFSQGEPCVHVLDRQGEKVDLKHTGWSHF